MAENIQLAGLVVDLLLNTASFEAGSTKAQRIANKAAKDIDKEFRSLQGALSGIFSRLGPIGEAAASALDQVGSAASVAMGKLGGLGKGIGLLGAGVAGLGALAAATSAGLVAMAAHAAEGAAKLEDLSHSTGVSVEALSQLQAVGHLIAPDVDLDTIAKGLERFGRATLNAATASTTMITPFQRLGIAIRDANGQMRPTEAVLADVATKFSQMSDGAIKTGLAMELFGRGGAALIPIFDEGGQRMREIIDLATKLGVVIGTGTAEAAHKFKENISTLELAFQGLENQVMEAMLPAITDLTNRMVQFFSETTPERAKFIHDLTDMAQAFLKLAVVGGEALRLIANNLAAVVDVMEIFSHGERSLGTVLDQAGHRTLQWATDTVDILKGIPAAMTLGGGPKTPFDQLDELESRLKTFDRAHNTGGVNLQSNAARQAELTIISQIQKLQAQADAEGMLAQAISEVSSATIEATAHAEALKTIAEMNAVAGKYGVSVTKEQAAAIEQATLRLEAYKAALKVNKDLQDNIDKTKIAAESTKELAAAYQQGGEAIEKALEKAKLSTLADAVNDLKELHDKLGQLPLSGKSAELFNTLGKSLQQAQEKLNAAAIAEHAQAMNDAALASAKLGDNLKFETEEMQKQIAATLQGTNALRAFNAQKQIDVFVQDHPGTLTADQIAGLRQQAASLGEAETELQVVQKFRSSENVKSIGDEIAELTKYHDVLVKDSTDELTYQAKMHDLLLSQQKAWDELLLKTNDTRAGVRVFFDEMAVNGETAAQRIHDSLTSTFNSLEDTFARFVEGQKVSWKELGNQILGTFAKQSIDQALRRGITALDTLFGGKLGGQQEAMNEKIPGAAGPVGIGSTIAQLFGIGGKTNKPDGSASNPLHVKVVSGGFQASSTEAGSPNAVPSLLSSLPLAPPPAAVSEVLGLPTPAPEKGTSTSIISQITSFLPAPVRSIASFFSGAKNAAASPPAAGGNDLGSAASALSSSASQLSQAAQALVSAAQSMSSSGTTAGGGGLSSLFSSEGDTSSGGGSDFLSQMSTILPFLTAAEGGHVSGPGTSTSDSIPAMLSAGEYVINAKAVQRVGKNHLDAINSGQPLRHFVTGGDVTPGKAYILSQTHSGYSMPSSDRITSSSSGDSSDRPGVTVVNHFHDIHDLNTFKASESQIQGHMMRSAYAAHGRNG